MGSEAGPNSMTVGRMVDRLLVLFPPVKPTSRWEVLEASQHEKQRTESGGVKESQAFQWIGENIEGAANCQIREVVGDGGVTVSIVFVLIALTRQYLYKVSIKCGAVFVSLLTRDPTLCLGSVITQHYCRFAKP